VALRTCTVGVANRERGTIEKVDAEGNISLRLEDGRNVQFNTAEHSHFDYGYAVTSHSSQGLTADRVLINIDMTVNPQLINSRFPYVAVSGASVNAEIYTNDAIGLGQRLSGDVSKNSAVEFSQSTDSALKDLSIGQGL
jgi:ATP-dependent exoDNAse (exonuclease V) alpha subunit